MAADTLPPLICPDWLPRPHCRERPRCCCYQGPASPKPQLKVQETSSPRETSLFAHSREAAGNDWAGEERRCRGKALSPQRERCSECGRRVQCARAHSAVRSAKLYDGPVSISF